MGRKQGKGRGEYRRQKDNGRICMERAEKEDVGVWSRKEGRCEGECRKEGRERKREVSVVESRMKDVVDWSRKEGVRESVGRKEREGTRFVVMVRRRQ